MEFLEQVLPDYKKPKLEAEPIKPKPTTDELIDFYQAALYEEKLTKVRQYNDYMNKTSLNMWSGFFNRWQAKKAQLKKINKGNKISYSSPEGPVGTTESVLSNC